MTIHRDSIRTAQLDKVRIHIKAALNGMLLDAKVNIEQLLTDEFLVSGHGYLWGEHVGEKTIRYPADWWQAFKARWFPNWALRLWPAIYTVHQVSFRAIYPNYRPQIPDLEWLPFSEQGIRSEPETPASKRGE